MQRRPRSVVTRSTPGAVRRPAPSLDSASAFWSVSWLSIAHLRRAGLMSIPSRSRRSSARKAVDVGHRLALDLVGQEARARLADRAAAAGEPDPLDDAVADRQLERDPVAAERVRALEGRGRILDDPEVMGPPIVLEDVVAVQIVHSVLGVVRAARSIPSFFVGIESMSPAVRRQSRGGPTSAVGHQHPVRQPDQGTEARAGTA